MTDLRAAIKASNLAVAKHDKALHLRCKLREGKPHPLLAERVHAEAPVAIQPTAQFHRSLSVLSWNVSAIATSKVDLLALAASHDADVLCIQETHLVSSTVCKLDPYRIAARLDRLVHWGGGLIIAVKSDIVVERIAVEHDECCQALLVRVSKNAHSLCIGCLYHAPVSSSVPHDAQLADKQLQQLMSQCDLLVGDANAAFPYPHSDLAVDERAENFLDHMVNSQLCLLDIPAPSRISAQHLGTPDFLLASSSLYNRCALEQLPPYSSDHTAFVLRLSSRDKQRRARQKRGRGYRLHEADWSVYRSLLSHTPPDLVSGLKQSQRVR
eukprot:5571321-Amphidinium_carterae.1